MLGLVFLLLVILVGGEGQIAMEDKCHPFVLENECEYVVDASVVPEGQQQSQFDLVAQSISDIRMVYASCRRPLIWLTCVSVFDIDNCSNETSREGGTDVVEGGDRIYGWCEEVNKECDGILNCTEVAFLLSFVAGVSPPSSDPPSSYGELPDLDDPIPTTTCQNGKEELDCCFTPYLRDNYGECVIGCGEVPNFGREGDEITIIVSYVTFFVGLFLTIVFMLPFFFTKNFLKFPSYALPLSIFFQLCSIQFLFWSLYTGHPEENYFCRDFIPITEAYDNLLNAWYCPVQFLSIGFFFIMTALWQTVVVIMLINITCRNKPAYFSFFFAYFHEKDKFKTTQIVCHVFFLTFGLVFSLSGGILTYENNLLLAAPPLYICWRGGESYANLMWIPLLLPLFLVLLGIVFVVTMLLLKDIILLRIHWRLVAYLIHNIFVFVVGNVAIWYMSQKEDYASRLVDFATCVTENPNEDGFCSLEEGVFGWWLFFNSTLATWPPISAFAVYGTNPFFRQWWFHLIFKQEILRDPSSMNTTRKDENSIGSGSLHLKTPRSMSLGSSKL